MAITEKIVQAHRQAPWRTQLQRAGIFLLFLVGGVLVAGVYLNISAQAATAGLEIQDLESRKEESLRRMADLKNSLAIYTSAPEMARRAKDLGFKAKTSLDPTYMIISGYPGRSVVILAPPPGPDMIPQPILKPIYTQSLWEFLFQGTLPFNGVFTGGQP